MTVALSMTLLHIDRAAGLCYDHYCYSPHMKSPRCLLER